MTTEFQPTLVNSMEDIIRILEEQPVWADRMRSIILGKELLALPPQFLAFMKKTDQAIETLMQGQDELRQGQDELRQGQDELRQGQDELRQGQIEIRQEQVELRREQAKLQADVANLKGTDYEARAATHLAALMPAAAGLTRIRVIKSIKTPESENLADTLDSALESGAATREEIRDIRLSDIIASARHTAAGQWGYVIAEASVTLADHDIDRAARRAAAMQRATSAPATPAVIGTAIPGELQAQAAAAGVTVIILGY